MDINTFLGNREIYEVLLTLSSDNGYFTIRDIEKLCIECDLFWYDVLYVVNALYSSDILYCEELENGLFAFKFSETRSR